VTRAETQTVDEKGQLKKKMLAEGGGEKSAKDIPAASSPAREKIPTREKEAKKKNLKKAFRGTRNVSC